jgi:hypothetical protein
MNFEDIKNRFDTLKTNPPQTVHPKIKGVIISILDKACNSKDNRYQFAIALGMKPHTGDWTAGEWYAVSQMVKPDRDPALGWTATNKNFQEVIGVVMAKIGRNNNQMDLFTIAPLDEAQELVRAVSEEVEAQG